MADYSQSIDFSAKDALATGDANKVAKGADIDTELALISTAIASKVDESREAQASGIATLDGNTLIPVAQLPAATTTAVGVLEIATDAETTTGTATDKWITPANLQAVLDQGGGMADDIVNLADPNVDSFLFWDDSDGAVEAFTVGTGLTSTATAVEVDMLGLEDLTDPGADRIFFWDDGGTASGFLTATGGLEISTTNLQIADVAATTTNPIDIASGAFTLDVEALTTIEGNALAATDTFYVEDGGVSKGIEVQAMGLRTQLAQTTQTVAAADMNTIMEFTGTATLTLPLNATTALPIGVPIILNMKHASQVLTVTADTSVTLVSLFNPGGGSAASDAVKAGGTGLLYKTAADVWVLTGDIQD